MSDARPLSLLVWYTISSGSDGPLPIARDQLKQMLTDAGMDGVNLPASARTVDSFRSATTNASDEYDSGKRRVRLVVRETGQSVNYVMRRVFKQWTDDDGDIQEQRVADLQFFRPERRSAGRVQGSERLRCLVDQRLRGIDRARVTALVQRIETHFEANRDLMSTAAVRAVVRGYLDRIGAVQMAESGGGAYLVSPAQRAEVESLKQLVLACGQNCRFRIIPLPDEPDLRTMVIESIDTDLAARAEAVARDINDWMGEHPKGSPTTPRWLSWRSELSLMQDWLVAYADLYDNVFPTAAAALERLLKLTETVGLRVAAARRSGAR